MAARKYGSIPTMNRNSGLGQLTNRQYMQLGRAISSPDMESIALGYLQFDEEIIKSLRHENRGNFEAFNRDIIKRWANKNSGSDQVRVRAFKNRELLIHKRSSKSKDFFLSKNSETIQPAMYSLTVTHLETDNFHRYFSYQI